LSGDFCTTIREHFHCWRTTHFPLNRRIIFAPDSIAIALRPRVTQPGGNANKSVNGYRPFPSTMNNSAASSARWIGWIKRVLSLEGKRSRLPVFNVATDAVALQIMSQLLASSDIKFAGGENGNVFYHDGTLRDPKIWDATLSQYSAQFIHLDGIGC
jgi:hypothetical protein